MTLHLGKRPATYRPDTLRWSDVKATVSGLPTIPKPHGGYGRVFPNGHPGWGMLGNGPCDDGSIPTGTYAYEGAGDCAWAGPGHETMLADHNGGRTVPQFTCKNILDQYAVYLGLSSSADLTSANDAGSDVQDVLQHRATTGLLDTSGTAHKIAAYVSIEPGNTTDLWEALWLFETVGIGIKFPETAMSQFNNGEIWSVVDGATIEGGHYIPLVGHPSTDVWTCVTWGCRQTMNVWFLQLYCDEAYAYISTERYNAVTGDTLEHYNDADLEKYLSLVGKTLS